MCGGTRPARGTAPGAGGLSPRVRGNPGAADREPGPVGSIPACAGEPPGAGVPGCGRQVYPRVCGGTIFTISSASLSAGLSPRVRGNQSFPLVNPAAAGSIPACAGEPHAVRQHQADRQVYPRVCGGTWVLGWAGGVDYGLSPRVRGNRRFFTPPAGQRRSIPACAGEPARWTCSDRW